MNPLIARHLAPWLLAHIAEPSIRSLLLAAFAALVLAACRPKGASLRLAIWTTVLYAALAMPFLGGFLPALRLRLPAIHATKAGTALVSARSAAGASSPGRWLADGPHPLSDSSRKAGRDRGNLGVPSVGRELSAAGNAAVVSQPQPGLPARRTVAAAPDSDGRNLPLVLLVCLYLLVAGILLAHVAMGIVLRRRLQRGSQMVDDLRARALFHQVARTLGITKLPSLAESNTVAVPATMGIRHPVILLPSGWRQWNDAKLSAVLAHELSHVKRRDALTRLLSAVHLCIFWFSPLAWWLDRKIGELAEEASDEAALQAGAGATYYAEMLLDFFATLGRARRRVRWDAISLVQGSRAERRLDRIFRANPTLRSSLRKPALFLLVACATPVACFVAAVHPFVTDAQPSFLACGETLAQAQPSPAPAQSILASPAVSQGAPPAPPAPAAPNPQLGKTVFPKGIGRQAPPAPSAMPQPASALLTPPAMLAALPPLPASPRSPAPPGSAPSESPSSDNESNSWIFGDEGADYAIVSGKSLLMSGSQGERDEVDALRGKISGNFIWFRRDAKSYVIQEPATVSEAVEFFAPEQELGREQAALGKQQALVGMTQTNLGKRMTEARVPVPGDLAARLEKAEATIKQLGANTSPQELGRLQGELGQIQAEIARAQADIVARREATAFSREVGALGREQGELGREQGRLGRQQARMARQANREMRRLIDRALARGIARPLQ